MLFAVLYNLFLHVPNPKLTCMMLKLLKNKTKLPVLENPLQERYCMKIIDRNHDETWNFQYFTQKGKHLGRSDRDERFQIHHVSVNCMN